MRKVMTVAVAAACIGLTHWAGCTNDNAVLDQPTTAASVGPSSGPGGPTGLGVGDPCTADGECRSGLACDAATSVCVPGHSLAEGSPCTISAECLDGLYCEGGSCAQAGNGQDTAACSTDADCASGYRCALVGLTVQCVPEGATDAGGTCTTSADCFGGLVCEAGTCAMPANGSPPFESSWPGESCMDDPGPVQAYFRIPRGMNDGDFYRLPFPNDVRLVNGQVRLTGHPSPGIDLLGYDLVDRYIKAIEADTTGGFGLYPSTFFRFSGDLDFNTFTGNVRLLNLTKSQALGLYYTYSFGGGGYICGNWLAIRAAQGLAFTPGDTYAAVLLTGIKAMGGAPVQRSPDLAALVDPAMPSDPAVAAEWPKYAPLRAYLTASMTDPTTVLNATVFTIGQATRVVEQLNTVTQAAAAPAVANWTRCDTGVMSPCPDASGERACGPADPDFDELHALVSLPIYQNGTAPYLLPSDGGEINLDSMGIPSAVRTEQVCLSLSVPKAAVPMGGFPTLVFAHGAGGHFRSHVTLGIAKDFALGVNDGVATVQAAVLGIDQVAHGPRRGGSTASPYDLFYNFTNPQAARGNVQQGAADLMALLRLVPTISLDAASSPTGSAFNLSNAVALWGHAQGASQGALALPYGNYLGAAFSGQGASLLDTLLGRTSPVNTAGALPYVLADAAADGTLRGARNHPALNLLQSYLDGADPLAYAKFAAKTPLMTIAAHHVLQLYGQADGFSPPFVQATFALAAGLGLAAHDASVTAPDDIGGLTVIPLPASGNLTVGGQPTTAMVRQYRAAPGADPLSIAFDLPTARTDAERFLAGALGGGPPQVGP